MIKGMFAGLCAALMVGCASTNFGDSALGSIVNTALDACKTVPLEEIEACFKDQLENRPDGSGITLEDLLEAAEAARADEATE